MPAFAKASWRSATIIWFSILFYIIVSLSSYEHTYIYGVNIFFWSALIGLVMAVIVVAMNEEELEEPSEDK